MIIASGEKVKSEPDFQALATYGLSHVRTYRSADTSGSLFGSRWRSTFDYPTLSRAGCFRHPDFGNLCIPNTVTFSLPDGATFTFNRTSALNGFRYVGVGGAAALGSFVWMPGSEWALTRDNKRFVYSDAGRIQRVSTLGGTTLLQFTYSSNSAQPISVSNAAGQNVEFTYLGGRVSTLRDPSGNVWSYGYNANRMLATVTSPGPSPDVRTYHYEDGMDSTLLTGISINGVRQSIYAYLPDKRVRESGLVGGEERDTFVYGTNQTTVTSALGKVCITHVPARSLRAEA